jgi:DNA invertase Pin-like site-specific DNA recombinase
MAILAPSAPVAQRIAALYLRVSTPGQAESKNKATLERNGQPDEGKRQETSLDTQEAAGRRHAVAHGDRVDEAYIYREVHTGVELWERPALTRLREAIRRVR